MGATISGGKKYGTTFGDSKQVKFDIYERIGVQSKTMAKQSRTLIPVGTRKKTGPKRTIDTVEVIRTRNDFNLTSLNHTGNKKYKGKGRYGYKQSLIQKNRNKYQWFLRTYQSQRVRKAMLRAASPVQGG